MAEQQWVFGVHAVQAVLERHPEDVVELLLQHGREDGRLAALQQQAQQLGLRWQAVSRQQLEKRLGGGGDKQVHQGVAALCRLRNLARDEAALWPLLEGLDHAPLLLVLDGVTDPHNLGACLRSADAAGVDAVVVPRDRSAPVNMTVRKVACGAAEHVPLFAVTNLARTLDGLRERGIWLSGAAGEADRLLYAVDLRLPTALVMGAEGKGLRRLTRERCDHLVALPMSGAVSSLNVSVATGICLFEAVRQRLLP